MGLYRDFENRVYGTIENYKNDLNLGLFDKFLDRVKTKKPLQKTINLLTLVLLEIDKLKEKGVPIHEIADIYSWLALRTSIYDDTGKFEFCPFEEAFNLYYEIGDYSGVLYCGRSLFTLYERRVSIVEEEAEEAIGILKKCLGLIEKKEGINDFYCEFLWFSCTAFNYLSQKVCQKYLSDFLIDYKINDIETGIGFYHSLCSAIIAVLNTNDNLSPEEKEYWLNNYDKYKGLYDCYKEKKK